MRIARKNHRHFLRLLTATALSCHCGRDGNDSDRLPDGPANLTEAQREQVAEAVTARLENEGWTVQRGRPFYFEIEDCRHLDTCYGNNPSSPYGLYFLPRGPNESSMEDTATVRFDGSPEGMSSVWRLDPAEAILYLGRTPPTVAYFSFRSYLFQSLDPGIGRRVDIFASLGDAVNVANVATAATPDGREGQPFDAETAVITTADAGADRVVREALADSGFDPSMHNTDSIPSALLTMGGVLEADTFIMLNRMALPANEAAAARYRDNPPAVLLRLTPPEEFPLDPMPVPRRKDRGTGEDESAWLPAVDALEMAIRNRHAELNAQPLRSFNLPLDGAECIAEKSNCLGDITDTTYAVAPPQRLQADRNEFMVAYGVNHAATGKSTYSNLVVMNQTRLMGVAGLDSHDMPGSAAAYLPQHPNADKLFAVKISRHCGTATHCIEVPTEFPGVGLEDNLLVVFRAYLEPGRDVGPLASELVLPRLMKFSAP